MKITTRSVVLCAVLGALSPACVTSAASRCSDLVCPAGMMCSPSGDQCVDTDLVAACRGGGDGEACTVAGMPPATCLGGVCQANRCGDGRVTGAEECDGNALKGRTCREFGFYEQEALRCGADCRYDTSQCLGRCGDGIKNGSELCDGKDLGGATCFNAGFYKAAGLACKPDCSYDVRSCTGGRCGDGIINGLEQCDGPSLNNKTCETLGFKGAMSGLTCSPSCTYTTRSCLCNAGLRCKSKTQRCDCAKFGCGCVADQP